MPVCSTCGTQYGATVRICVRDGTPLVAGRANDPYLGALLDGKYRIESFISAGGMGAVYRAQHVMLGKTVAVKLIRRELVTSDEIVSRFQREARAASNLNHPNIVTVHDLGQTADGTLYIAMEFIEGASLHDTIRKNGPLAPARTVGILSQVASALSAAHRRQIVHRDLKSHNLMLAVDDSGHDVVKLVDFGIAKTFDEATQLTAAGYMLGTPHYMSPEQACGQPVDHRADIYSLGVILYEMLTGQVPFGDDSLSAVLVKLATEVPPPPSTCRPDLIVPTALERVAMRCLEKDPARRFQSADEFAHALVRARATAVAPLPVPAAAAAATLVRPPAQPQRALERAQVSDGALLSVRTAAIAAAIGVALAVAIASGVALSRDPGAATVAPASLSAVSTTPASATMPAADRVGAPPERNADGGVVPIVPEREYPDPPGARTRIDQPEARLPTPPATPLQAPPAVAAVPGPASAPAPAQAVPAAVPPPAPATPVVSGRCDGFPDVCSVIRAEMTRAFQRAGMTAAADGAPADAVVTAAVTLVSQTASADFGTPMLTRTYSVELIGNAGDAALGMPEPRRFSFDPRFGGARLDEQARLIAADAVESVRVFLVRTGR